MAQERPDKTILETGPAFTAASLLGPAQPYVKPLELRGVAAHTEVHGMQPPADRITARFVLFQAGLDVQGVGVEVMALVAARDILTDEIQFDQPATVLDERLWPDGSNQPLGSWAEKTIEELIEKWKAPFHEPAIYTELIDNKDIDRDVARCFTVEPELFPLAQRVQDTINGCQLAVITESIDPDGAPKEIKIVVWKPDSPQASDIFDGRFGTAWHHYFAYRNQGLSIQEATEAALSDLHSLIVQGGGKVAPTRD